MWPFKAKTSTSVMSGIATCDGKHHLWSSWTQYSDSGRAFGRNIPIEGVSYIEARQFRKCKICGFTEDKLVRGME